MKKHQRYSKITYLLLWFCVSILLSSPGFAQDITVATHLSQTRYEIGTIFQVEVTVDLQNVLTIGGYIYLQYDPAIFECTQVRTSDFLGISESRTCEQIQPGVLRLETTVLTFADAATSSMQETLFTITFEAKTLAEAAAIQLQQFTQIFGSGMGNIVSVLDDSATRQITTFTPLIVSLNLPESGSTLNGLYSFEWLIENSITAPIYFTLELTQDQGNTWNLIANTSIEPSGTYQWDTTEFSNSDDYILRANILNDYKDFQVISSSFNVANLQNIEPVDPIEPNIVPEPSMLFLFGFGIFLLCSIKRKFLLGRK